jgi:hypothetical protein
MEEVHEKFCLVKMETSTEEEEEEEEEEALLKRYSFK